MIQVSIENPTVLKKSGTSARTGKAYEIREQQVVVNGVGRFPLETKIQVPDGVDGYEPGLYEVTQPLTVGRFGFEVPRDLGLKLLKPATKQA